MSLTSLCLTNIADMVSKLPPMIQDEVIKESHQVIKTQVKDELREEFKDEIRVEIQKDFTNYLEFIIPEIMEDMISSIISGDNNKDYYKEYERVPKFIVKCAIDIAKSSVLKTEERYLHQSFVIRGYRDMNNDSDSDYPRGNDYGSDY
jgi:hypothetical protein